MKTNFIFSVIIIALIIGSCSQLERNFPHGAWEIVKSYAVYGGDSVVNLVPTQIKGEDVAIWTEHRYNYVGQFKFINDTTSFDHFGGGTYTLDGNRYEANIIWDYKKNVVGKKVNMLLEQKNDTLFMTFPVDKNWEKDKNFYYVIKYVKID